MSCTQKIDLQTFRQIFLDHWTGFKDKYPSYMKGQYGKVVQKMLGCGKEQGGYTEYMCMSCGQDSRRIAFTCKSSFCLSCAKVYVDNFVNQVSKKLHNGVIYRHVILTIPEQLRVCFYNDRDKGLLLSALMATGYNCLESAVSKVKRRKIKLGAIIVVQTHGRSGKYNPHLHVMMTSGGINEQAGKWVDLNYFDYEVLRKKWQYYLLNMMKKLVPSQEMVQLVDVLWKRYPNGLVTNIKKGDVPEKCKGLAKYLAKYLACPPISVRRIVRYEKGQVTYWYKDHASKRKKVETVAVYTFIGRMVQHILPKGFQRVRYYGLEYSKSFSKWSEVIKEGFKRIGRRIRGAYQIVSLQKYRERYQEVSGRDPMICKNCGCEMELFRRWHPKYGVIYDEWEEIKKGKYEPREGSPSAARSSIRPSAGVLQLSLFELPA